MPRLRRRRTLAVSLALIVVAVSWREHRAAARGAAVYTWFTWAGVPTGGGSRDGVGLSARFRQPMGVAIAGSGAIYVADTNNHTVRRVVGDVVTTIAGAPGVAGATDAVGTAARFNAPVGLAVDGSENVYVADTGNSTIRKISPDGHVTTVAGVAGQRAFVDGTGSGARFSSPTGIAVNAAGAIFVADTNNQRVRAITPAGVVSTLAGNGVLDSIDGTGTGASFRVPYAIAVGGDGTIYVGDQGAPGAGTTTKAGIRLVTPAGVVTTLIRQDSGALPFVKLAGLAVDASGNVYVSDFLQHRIAMVTPGGTASTFAGVSASPGSLDGDVTSARLNQPRALAFSGDGILYVADTANDSIRTIEDGVVSTAVGRASVGNGDGPGLTAQFGGPQPLGSGLGLASDSTGNVYVAEPSSHTIRKIAPDAEVSTLAGVPLTPGSLDGPAEKARFSAPVAVAVAATGDVFVADTGNHTIRRITPGGEVSTLAGLAGQGGCTDAVGADARFGNVQGIAANPDGSVWVTDAQCRTVRRIALDGTVTLVAGQTGSSGHVDGVGAAAKFAQPLGIAFGAGGVAYVVDISSRVIRAIAPDTTVTTVAGVPFLIGGQDGPAGSARFELLVGVAADTAGHVFVTDRGRHAIRLLDTVTATVSTIGGSPNDISGQLNGPGTSSRFTSPTGIAVDPGGHVYVVDTGNTIRWGRLEPTTIAPDITAHPNSIVRSVGSPATFAVAAIGTPAPTFQWQVSADDGETWTDIAADATYSGTTSPTLVVSNTTLALDGLEYRSVATNTADSATSAPGLLSVRSLTVAPFALKFQGTRSVPGADLSSVTPGQTVTVQQAPAAVWTAASDAPWAIVSPESGNGSNLLTVSVAMSGALLGTASDLATTITLSDAGATVVGTIPVLLRIIDGAAATVAPFGQTDQPRSTQTNEQGALGVTGWVLDDVGVAAVKIYRQCFPADEPANCQTGIVPSNASTPVAYVGDAAFVPGARPDVEALFPDAPQNNRAGWGYLLLTNMLPRITPFAPHGGQADIKLYPIAIDVDGHSRLLGSSWSLTIPSPTQLHLNNDAIAKPFGAIDTPTQGGTADGIMANFGWVLTPDLDTTADGTDILIPTDGSTLFVFLDGVAVSNVTYNQCRGSVGNPPPGGVYCDDDVANIFGNATPQDPLTPRFSNPTRFRNLDAGRGPQGSVAIDTTVLSNGLHSIAWSATDSNGRIEGIGSRNFIVINSGARPVSDAEVEAMMTRPAESRGRALQLEGRPVSKRPVSVRTGFDLRRVMKEIDRSRDFVRTVTVGPMDRVELGFASAVDGGYLIANGQLRDLPVGSSLDRKTGVFAWAPPLGYFGTYRLAFVLGNERVLVDVTVSPETVTKDTGRTVK